MPETFLGQGYQGLGYHLVEAPTCTPLCLCLSRWGEDQPHISLLPLPFVQLGGYSSEGLPGRPGIPLSSVPIGTAEHPGPVIQMAVGMNMSPRGGGSQA